MVGSAIVRRLQAGGYTNLITRTPNRRTQVRSAAGGRGEGRGNALKEYTLFFASPSPPAPLPQVGEGSKINGLQRCVHRLARTRQELDLLDQRAVFDFLETEKPDYIFMAAARVGGIYANNTYRADFIYENLTVQNNIIHGALKAGVKDLCFLGSSCIYPRDCPQPIREDYLLTGPLEQTNEPYAIAKIAGIKLCDSYNQQYGTQYVSVMPTNMYGPNDNYDQIGR